MSRENILAVDDEEDILELWEKSGRETIATISGEKSRKMDY